MASKSNKDNPSDKKKSRGGLIGMMGDLYGGRFLSIEFFKKNFIYIIAITVMFLMYISNKYTGMTYHNNVLALTDTLNNVTADWVNSKAKYNSLIRESNMKELMDSMNLGLTSPEQPPYTLQVK